jgi:hypothetical protein
MTSSAGPAGLKRYGNRSGHSGVVAYAISADAIVVEFQDGWKYEYTKRSAGAVTITTMHRLAAAGRGLSTFISRQVRDAYERKYR